MCQSPVDIRADQLAADRGAPLLLRYESSELVVPRAIRARRQRPAGGGEAHLVHTNAQGATAVVGVFYRRGPHPNPVLDRILVSAPEAAGEEAHAGEASPAALFKHLRGVRSVRGGRLRVNSFSAYDGSLTTPGCTEDVRWSVLADGGQVSKAAVARLHRVIGQFPNYDGYRNNNRPTQPSTDASSDFATADSTTNGDGEASPQRSAVGALSRATGRCWEAPQVQLELAVRLGHDHEPATRTSKPGISPLVHPLWVMRVRTDDASNGSGPAPLRSDGFPTGGRTRMADDDLDHQVQQRPGLHRSGRLLQAFSSPDSYGLVLLLILVTYALSATLTAAWAVSLVLFVQIGTIWVTLQASQAHRRLRQVTSAILVVTAIVAILNLFISRETAGGVMAVISGLLYVAAPVIIIRRLVQRRTVDTQTVLGAIAAYLMVGMSFAFAYRALGALQAGPFFGTQGEDNFSQDLFFSFTTLTTTGYGNLVPDANPGQTLAVLEMLIGQLFLVTAVARVVSAWQPGQDRGRPPTEPDSD